MNLRILLFMLLRILWQSIFLSYIGVMISYGQLIQNSGEFSSTLSTISLIGISFTGIFFNSILSRYKGAILNCYLSLLTLVISVALLFVSDKYYVLYTYVFLLSIIFGFESPNNSNIINRLISEKRILGHILSKYNIFAQIFSIAIPIINAYLILYTGYKYTLLILAVFCLLQFILWAIVTKNNYFQANRLQSKLDKTSFNHFDGYLILIRESSLRYLVISRVFNNFIFTGLIITMPMIIAQQFTVNEKFTIIQNLSNTLIALGFLINALISNKLLKINHGFITLFAQLATLFPFIGMILLFFFDFSLLSIILCSILFGIGQFFFRVSGMTIGQAITPIKNLSEVILASDTIVRILTACFSIILLFLYKYFDDLFPLLWIGVVSLLAPLFLLPTIKFYKKCP